MARQERDTAIYTAHDDCEPFDPSTPEKSLLRAILITAMADLKKSGDVARKAREYFLSAEEDYIFSFKSVCDYLNVDPKKVLMIAGLRRKGAACPSAQPREALSGE